MKSKESLICTNCKEHLNGKRQVFQGVIICDNCYKLVSHAIKRTQEELKMLFLVYTDMIRVGLLKGDFRPPVLPSPDKSMPPSELAKALRQMAIGGESAKDSDCPVRLVREDQNHSDGEVRDRRETESVPRRG